MAEDAQEKKGPGLAGKAGRGVLKLVLKLVGAVALLMVGFFVLVWGEARVDIATAVKKSTNLNDESASNGDRITYTGALTADELTSDPLLEGQFVVIERRVETCAWVATKEEKGEGEITKYERRWVADVPDSSDFESPGYDNPDPELKNESFAGSGIGVGEYAVASGAKFANLETIGVQKAQVAKAVSVDQGWAYTGTGKRCKSSGGDAAVGDQRVSFKVLRPGDLVTVYGKKAEGSIEPARGELRLVKGDREAMLAHVAAEPTSKLWIFRGVGALILWIALFLIISPVLKLVTWIPILGGLVGGAAKLATGLIALGFTVLFVFFELGMPFFMGLFGGLIE